MAAARLACDLLEPTPYAVCFLLSLVNVTGTNILGTAVSVILASLEIRNFEIEIIYIFKSVPK